MSVAVRAALLLLLALVLCSYTAANTDEVLDCCLTTSNKPIPQRIVKSYSVQTAKGGCRIPATLFITRANMKLCAPTASKSRWVAKLIKNLGKKPRKQRKGRKH